jgi:hypothetical protein
MLESPRPFRPIAAARKSAGEKMRKRLTKISLVSIFVFSLSFLNCQSSVENYPVDYVDRNTLLALDKKGKPLMLVVEVGEDGRHSVETAAGLVFFPIARATGKFR